MDFMGKVALITGASSGIGQATAIELAKRGADVVINYFRNKEGIEKTAQFIKAEGKKYLAIKADVTQSDQINDMVKKALEQFEKIDILVCNAGGIIERSKISDMSENLWKDMLDLNLNSVFFLCKALIPQMKRIKNGNIITLSSIAGRNGGGPGAVAYATAKAAIDGFTKGLAKELISEGIRVNAVSPGVIKTGFFKNTPTEVVSSFESSIPMKRMGKPEEVAKLIAFLVSEEASYITGRIFDITGGIMI